MADLKLNRILKEVENYESIHNYQMNEKKYSDSKELDFAFDNMRNVVFYMNQFGIITEEEFKIKRQQINDWYLDYDLYL